MTLKLIKIIISSIPENVMGEKNTHYADETLAHLLMIFTHQQFRSLAGSLSPPSGALDKFTFANGLGILSRIDLFHSVLQVFD